MNQKPLPNDSIIRLFDKFRMWYGVQKVGAMYEGIPEQSVIEEWAMELGQFSVDANRRALETLRTTKREWPPSLKEFMDVCRETRSAAHDPFPAALTAPDVSPEVVADNLAKIRQSLGVLKTEGAAKDFLFWAKRPKSAKAVELLAMGAKPDSRLRDILAAHLADGGEQCRGEDAVKALLAMAT